MAILFNPFLHHYLGLYLFYCYVPIAILASKSYILHLCEKSLVPNWCQLLTDDLGIRINACFIGLPCAFISSFAANIGNFHPPSVVKSCSHLRK